MQNSRHINPIFIHKQIGKNSLDPSLFFRNPSNCTQKIAIPNSPLKNIRGINLIPKQARIINTLPCSFPDNFLNIPPDPK